MSEFSRRKHREFGFQGDMEVVNYFLPDIEVEPRVANGSSSHQRPYFLFVGRLERIKGVDQVIEVCRGFEGADLLVAGDGEDGGRLRELATDLDNVVFLGRVDSSQLDSLYRNALALIVPSVGFETFGIILIEAFRHGTPVIARRHGPFPEIIERCGGGLLFETQTDLLAAMCAVKEDPMLRRALGRRARKGFERYWSESAVVPRYLEVVGQAAAVSGRDHIVSCLGGSKSQ